MPSQRLSECLSSRKQFKIVIAARVALAGPILIAVAGHTQTISACAKKNGGALREVSNQNQCKKNETFVSWEKQANAWNLTGNTGTSAATNFVGTTDDQPLEFRVNGARVMRLEPALAGVHGFTAPNVVGGASSNTVGSGVIGPLSSAGASGASPTQCRQPLARSAEALRTQ